MFFKLKEKLNLNSLRTIFEAQKKNLLENGYPALLSMSLENFNNSLEFLWKSVSEKINNIEIKIKGNTPLILVAQQGSLQEKIRKIKGHTELDFNKIKNNNQDQLNPFYILLDVEDGTKMLAKSTKDSLKRFEKEKRFALNLNESIALLTYYPETLRNHYLISAETFYNKEGQNLPLLWLLDEDNNPELHYVWFDIAHGKYGVGSYAIKIK